MNNKNFWGSSDEDSEPLPDWMNPETYRNSKPKLKSKSLQESIEEATKKPSVDLSYINKEQK